MLTIQILQQMNSSSLKLESLILFAYSKKKLLIFFRSLNEKIERDHVESEYLFRQPTLNIFCYIKFIQCNFKYKRNVDFCQIIFNKLTVPGLEINR